MKKTAWLLLVLSRIDEYLARVDNKASFELTFNTFILGGIIFGSAHLLISSRACIYLLLVLLLGVVFSSGAIICSFIASMPFLKDSPDDSSYNSLLFFGSIAKMSMSELKKRMSRKSAQQKEDLLCQVYILSKALTYKFIWIRRSRKLSLLSLCCLSIVAVIFLLNNYSII